MTSQLFDPINYLNFSKEILGRDDEVAFRTICNRTYLFSALSVGNELKRLNIDLSEDHRFYNEIEDKSRRFDIALPDILKTLRVRRIVADYRLNKVINKLDAEEGISNAESVMEIINKQ